MEAHAFPEARELHTHALHRREAEASPARAMRNEAAVQCKDGMPAARAISAPRDKRGTASAQALRHAMTLHGGLG